MARHMQNDTVKLYRAVIVKKSGHKDIYGPYEHKRIAGCVKSYFTDPWWAKDVEDSYIEYSETEWKVAERGV